MQKNILVLGSGGREHVFAWKLSQNVNVQVFVAPGNAGTAQVARNVSLDPNDFESVSKFCLSENIDTVIPGSEDPLVNGIVDYFEKPELAHIYVFGPSKEGARLEGSKEYAKKFMARHDVPTAKYESFTGEQVQEAKNFLRTMNAPYVLKADGLAAGKGVLICSNLEEADENLEAMLLDKKFGEASSKVVVEEFLDGIEFSVFAMTDGVSHIILPMAKDYKRIGEGDTGLNTGGMGAVSPVPFLDNDFMDKVTTKVVNPTMKGLIDDGLHYKGFVFFGLIKVGEEPYVIEYNVRMGDPETEVVLPRLQSDLVNLIDLSSNKRLSEGNAKIDPRFSTTVMSVSGGYPEAYEKGMKITIGEPENGINFHAGTKEVQGEIVTNGGRVIASTAFGETLAEALKNSYKNVENISFENRYYRTDIGQDLLRLENK
jgi:phosphoribosylamine--glycine ligase